jgi:SPP1 family predicted phage head-tail adaptor
MRMLNAGDLRHTITLQQRAAGKDAFGQAVETWETFLVTRAEVTPLVGTELFAAGQTQAPAELRVRMRYAPGITAAMRFEWDSVLYAITNVIDARGEHNTLELLGASLKKDTR